MFRIMYKRMLAATLASIGISGAIWAGPTAEPAKTDRIIVLKEDGKPERKCAVISTTKLSDGNMKYMVKALDTGEMLTLFDRPPKDTVPTKDSTPSPSPKVEGKKGTTATTTSSSSTRLAVTVGSNEPKIGPVPPAPPIPTPTRIAIAAEGSQPHTPRDSVSEIALQQKQVAQPVVQPMAPSSPYGLIPQNRPVITTTTMPVKEYAPPPAERQPAPINLDAEIFKPASPAVTGNKAVPAPVVTPAAPTSIPSRPENPVPSAVPIQQPTPTPAPPPATLIAPTMPKSEPVVVQPAPIAPGVATPAQPVKEPIPMLLLTPPDVSPKPGKQVPAQPVSLARPTTAPVQQMDAAIFRTLELRAALKSALQPSTREEAAEELANGPYARNVEIRTSLSTAAMEDPAPSVRAACIHYLAKLGLQDADFRILLEKAKNDKDERVRTEADQALKNVRKN